MKKEFSKNTTEVFAKTMFHYVPDILKYIDEIKDPRKGHNYSMRYLIMSEILMFLSEGKSQRFTETAYKDTKYLENIGKIIKEEVKKIPDAEIYTDVFSRILGEEIEKFQYKINYQMIRNKIYEESKVMGKYNMVLDASRFQKAHYEVSEEWLSQTKEEKTTWYISMLELKLIANEMAVSIMNEMIRNKDKKRENEIEYQGIKTNIIRQIKKNKENGKYAIWMWMTNREITKNNINKIIYCAKLRDYIENQGFREQKITSGIDLEHVYSKNVKAIKVIYTIIQITHLILQIIEHSDICEEFNKKYGSVKVFRRQFYAYLTREYANIKIIQIKIQIRFNKSTLTYSNYIEKR